MWNEKDFRFIYIFIKIMAFIKLKSVFVYAVRAQAIYTHRHCRSRYTKDVLSMLEVSNARILCMQREKGEPSERK